jgi:hypothetical protein
MACAGIQGENMRKIWTCFCLLAPLPPGAAELAGTWKYTAPPNPNAKGNQRPAETVYVIKVDGKSFTGTMLVNRGMSDILNGAIDGSQITFERLDASGARRRTKARSMATS